MRATSAAAWLESLPPTGLVLLYKHSPICGTSRRAQGDVSEFAATHPEIPVFRLDVVAERPLSQALAALLAVTHESPQAILLREGSVVWHGSHGAITASELDRVSRAAGAG